MSSRTFCDGCQDLCPESEERGLARKYDYCPACAQVVDERTLAMSQLQERIAVLWTEGLAEINDRALGKLPGMKFPI